MTYTEKTALVDNSYGKITLDGEKAAIVGAGQPFASVYSFKRKGMQVQFAWDTVKHIVETANGAFKS